MAQRCDGIRILLVEDDADSREILAQTLTAEGATVTAVSTAREALPFLSSVDIILTDFVMPGDDGVWLLEEVNKRAGPTPVIAMSGYEERQEPRLAAAPFACKLQAAQLRPVVCRDRRRSEQPSVIGRLDARGRRLRAALAAVLVRANAPELRLMGEWLDNWSGIGLIVPGITHQGWDVQLTAYAARDWRPTFFPVGIAHSVVAGSHGRS